MQQFVMQQSMAVLLPVIYSTIMQWDKFPVFAAVQVHLNLSVADVPAEDWRRSVVCPTSVRVLARVLTDCVNIGAQMLSLVLCNNIRCFVKPVH